MFEIAPLGGAASLPDAETLRHCPFSMSGKGIAGLSHRSQARLFPEAFAAMQQIASTISFAASVLVWPVRES